MRWFAEHNLDGCGELIGVGYVIFIVFVFLFFVLISTLHVTLAEIGLAAVEAGKHVLLEKPAGRHSSELEPVIAAAKKSNALVRVGFNHRYHRAFLKARELVDEDALGELMFIRA